MLDKAACQMLAYCNVSHFSQRINSGWDVEIFYGKTFTHYNHAVKCKCNNYWVSYTMYNSTATKIIYNFRTQSNQARLQPIAFSHCSMVERLKRKNTEKHQPQNRCLATNKCKYSINKIRSNCSSFFPTFWQYGLTKIITMKHQNLNVSKYTDARYLYKNLNLKSCI